MMAAYPSVVDVLVVPAPESITPAGVSLGLVFDTGIIGWGDVPLGDTSRARLAAQYARDTIAPFLRGQRHEGFRHFCALLRQAPGARPAAVLLALQQGWLDGIARSTGASVADLLAAEYPFAGASRPPTMLFLEISDFAATAERIDQMLALRPAGLGYRLTGQRVVEAIGRDGEHLQRFVRELGERARVVAGETYAPAIYLGLNGALGRLLPDPIPNAGKVLGNIVGLKRRAWDRQLLLEEPFLLPDPAAQAGHLQKLKELISSTARSAQWPQAPQLVARDHGLDRVERQAYLDMAAVGAFMFDLLLADDLDSRLAGLAQVQAAGFDALLHLPATATPRWAMTLVALAEAARPLAVLTSADDGVGGTPALASRLLAEQQARSDPGWAASVSPPEP